MRFIALFLLIGVSAASGSLNYFDCRDPKPIPYSEELVKKAEAGDAVAQWSLGMCYSGGRQTSEGFIECKEVKKNHEEAVKWFTKSAEQGNPEAQLAMQEYYFTKAGEYMRTSDNIPRINEAIKIAEEWLLKAAEGGNTSAQRGAAHMYFYRNSKGSERIENLNVAKKFYVKLAEKGDKEAERMARSCEFEIQKGQRQLKTTKAK